MNQTETDSSSADSGILTASLPSPIYGPNEFMKHELPTQGSMFYSKKNGENGHTLAYTNNFDLVTQFSNLNFRVIDNQKNYEFNERKLKKLDEMGLASFVLDNKFISKPNLDISKDIDDSGSENLSDFLFQPTCLSRISSLEAHELSLSESLSNQSLTHSKSLKLLEKMKRLMGENGDEDYDFKDKKLSKSLKHLKKPKSSSDIVAINEYCSPTTLKKEVKMCLYDLTDHDAQILKSISLDQLHKYNLKVQIPKDYGEAHRRSFKDIFYWRRSQPDSLNDPECHARQFCNRVFGISIPTCIKNEEFCEKLNHKYEAECSSILTSICRLAGLKFAPNKRLKCPKFVLSCTEYLLKNGLNQVGIFRVNGSRTRTEELKKQINSNCEMLLESSPNIHDVASLLKEFFRELPEPLISKELYIPLIAVDDMTDLSEKIKLMKLIIALLPSHNRDTLYVLLILLNAVSLCAKQCPGDKESLGNKMNASNLATIFALNIIRPSKKITRMADEGDLQNHASAINAISLLITHFLYIFQVDDIILERLNRDKERNVKDNCCQTEINLTPIRRQRPHSALPNYPNNFLDNANNNNRNQQYHRNGVDDSDHINSLDRRTINNSLDLSHDFSANVNIYAPFSSQVNLDFYKRRLPYLPSRASSSPYKLKFPSHNYPQIYPTPSPNYTDLLLESSRLSKRCRRNELISGLGDEDNDISQFSGCHKSWAQDRWEQWQKETELKYLLTGEYQTLV